MERQTIEQNIIFLEQIKIASYVEIPVNQYSPVYKLFQYRQELAKRFFESGQYNEIYLENLKLSFKHCNEQIKKYLGL